MMTEMKHNTFEDGLVSVITPAFNSSKFIEDCIRSVQAQSYLQWEMLIAVDAGTTDNTVEIIETFSKVDPRVELVLIKNKRGISLSRNTAIDRARGRYIAFLDSDDLWLPHKLERQLKFMEKTQAPYSCTGYRRLSEDGSQVGDYIGVSACIDYELTLRNNTIGCPTIIIDRNKVGTVHFVEGRHEDFILNLEILKR
jgi:teichuronic acid biosynthesis glycosyltransferase TuaG